jgi:pimeloyl-ACP methyl ester carboxylesterase
MVSRDTPQTDLEVVFFEGADGLRIAADVGGPKGAPVVILAHGGGQTRHSWKDTAVRLAQSGYRVANIDLRGHGESGWAKDGDYELPVTARDMDAVVRASAGAAGVHLVGASWGGLTAMVAAPNLMDVGLHSIVLVDVVPHVNMNGSDRIQKFMRRHLDGFANLEEAADAVAAYRPDKPRPSDPSRLLKNLRRTEDGRFYWHWDPARLTRKKVLDLPLLEAAAARISIPVLLIRGGRSDIVTDEGVAQLRAMLPQLEVVAIKHADHMVVGDDNRLFAEGLIDFLERTSPARHAPSSAI